MHFTSQNKFNIAGCYLKKKNCVNNNKLVMKSQREKKRVSLQPNYLKRLASKEAFLIRQWTPQVKRRKKIQKNCLLELRRVDSMSLERDKQVLRLIVITEYIRRQTNILCVRKYLNI